MLLEAGEASSMYGSIDARRCLSGMSFRTDGRRSVIARDNPSAGPGVKAQRDWVGIRAEASRVKEPRLIKRRRRRQAKVLTGTVGNPGMWT
ncbi:hypothetical protein CGRA01v4_04837 [Colletotrichum graminicola]|nr:hypothetical protein CGRA01v4_04837 [Colletotrichum graminicola]